jgi:hypothetical protein
MYDVRKYVPLRTPADTLRISLKAPTSAPLPSLAEVCDAAYDNSTFIEPRLQPLYTNTLDGWREVFFEVENETLYLTKENSHSHYSYFDAYDREIMLSPIEVAELRRRAAKEDVSMRELLRNHSARRGV